MITTTQAPSLLAIVTKLYEDTTPMIASLYSRWLDERQYEDIKDYAKPLESMVNAAGSGAKIVKMTKRPFGMVVEFRTQSGPCQVHFYVKGNRYHWSKYKA